MLPVLLPLLLLVPLELLAYESRAETPKNDHFDGKHFHNNPHTPHKSFFEVLRWRLDRVAPVEIPIKPPTTIKPSLVNLSEAIHVTFVGHSTFLLQAHGINILTDPIWSDRCSPVSFIGPKRLHDPGIDFNDLPKVDAVVISHNHYDHMDLPTLIRLWERDRPVFFVPLKNRHTLHSAGISLTHIVEQDWWQTTPLRNGVRITATPAQHWSGRWIVDRNQALWAGFVISFGAKNVFFAGDTGFGPHFVAIKERFKNFHIALLPIGAFMPRWFMRDHHMSPSDAIEAAKILKATTTVPMHFGTFALGDDGFSLARAQLDEILEKNQPHSFTILAVGERLDGTVSVARALNKPQSLSEITINLE